MHNIFFTVLAVFGLTVIGAQPTPNWDTFDDISFPNVSASLDIITRTPLSRYWDTSKAEFRTGCLGFLMREVFPELTSMAKSGKSEVSIVVDTNALFTHMLVATKHLATRYAEHESRLHVMLREKKDFALKVLRVANETNTEWRTASELRARREVLAQQRKYIENRLQSRKRIIDSKHEVALRLHEEKKRALMIHHETLNSTVMEQHLHLLNIEREKQQRHYELAVLAEEKRFESAHHMLLLEQQAEAARAQLNTTNSLQSLRFRFEEETRAKRENEQLHRKILQAKGSTHKSRTNSNGCAGEAFRKNFESAVDKFASSLLRHQEYLLAHPDIVLQAAAGIVVIVLIYLVIVEAYAAIIENASMWMRRRQLSVVKRGTGTASLADVLLSEEMQQRLTTVTQMLMDARERDGVLPNILISGVSGVGKTLSAQTIAEASKLPYLMISGGDILSSEGMLRGRFLKDTLHDVIATNGRHGALLIIDEADQLICSRESGASAARDCLHILLQYMRENTSALSVILTTSLPLSHVDSAILDRMDCTLILSLPSEALRLKCLCHSVNSILRPYISSDHVSLLDQLLAMPPAQALIVIRRSQSPETDTPLSESLSEVVQLLQACGTSGFNILHCLNATVVSSDGWSYRELVSLVHSVQSQVLGSESCTLNSDIWIKQLEYMKSRN